jgi:hypothetical protein
VTEEVTPLTHTNDGKVAGPAPRDGEEAILAAVRRKLWKEKPYDFRRNNFGPLSEALLDTGSYMQTNALTARDFVWVDGKWTNFTRLDALGNIYLDGDMTFTQKLVDYFTQEDKDTWVTDYGQYLNQSSLTRDIFAPGIAVSEVKNKILGIYPKDSCCGTHFYKASLQACCGAQAVTAAIELYDQSDCCETIKNGTRNQGTPTADAQAFNPNVQMCCDGYADGLSTQRQRGPSYMGELGHQGFRLFGRSNAWPSSVIDLKATVSSAEITHITWGTNYECCPPW